MSRRFWKIIQWTALVLGVPFFVANSLLDDLADFAERKANGDGRI